jgi:large subunit ribosomal protein L23
MHPLEVLRRPVVTEKSVRLTEEGKYVFHTHPNANKLQIKEAVAQAFDVTVLRVNTMTMPGKRRRSRQRGGWEVRSKSWKKAIVTLAPGERIELFESP